MKNELRSQVLKKRDSITPEQKAVKDDSIKTRLFNLEEFIDAKSVLMYVSFRTEVDTFGQLKGILCLGKKLIVPFVNSNQKTLILYEIKDTSELKPGYMGIPEPEVSEDRKVELNDIDLIVVPGTGFDIKGDRIGYGGGYYDRLLSSASKKITTIALAFEEQIVENIPAEPHDMKMNIIVTDERVIRC
ncbi:MAG: 5-formyltetrahydrofolate cyclo-ligase [Nitrospira sp.]|nr:5-formyltetrahydrofolate cyclo-ligase [Nitrospira sp.]